MKVKDLKINPNNPQRFDDLSKLENSIRDFPKMMKLRPLVYDPKTMIVLGGNKRLLAIQNLGLKEIPDEWVRPADELTEEEKKRFIIADNVGFGEWDWEILESDYEQEELEEWGIEFPEMEEETPEAKEDDFEVPDEIQTDIKIGDIFQIGEHRLMCGDSTDPKHVAKLMNGEKADISFTSPPYNAGNNALGGNKNKVDNKYEKYNDNKSQSEWKILVSDVLNNCLINSENVFYNIQQLAGNKIGFIELLYNFRERYVDEIIWIKGHGQPAASKNVLNSRFEHIIIFRNEDKPKRTITTGDFHGTISNYYEGNGNSKNEFSSVHAATFPIHLPEFIIKNFCKRFVLDLFIGTGTTMVAAHQLNRKCYGMELDPKYCQVVIDRMKKLDPTIEIKKL